MSHKQAKRIRVALRNKGINVKQTAYKENNERSYRVKLPNSTTVTVHTYTAVLQDWCGRSKYKQAKRF
jgi:hypothetical protein